MSYKININSSDNMIPRIIKFPNSPSNNNNKQNKKIAIPPAQNPSTPEFAFELLEAQLQLQSSDSVSQKLISKLFELYRLGIQHYNQKRSRKESYFKKRIQALTNNPAVLGALHQCQRGADTFYKKKQIQKLVEIDQKKSVAANDIMRSVFKCQLKVQSQLKNQSESILKRINERRLLKKSCQGQNDSEIDQIPTPKNSKVTKTVIVQSSNPQQQQDQQQYFVDGVILSDDDIP